MTQKSQLIYINSKGQTVMPLPAFKELPIKNIMQAIRNQKW